MRTISRLFLILFLCLAAGGFLKWKLHSRPTFISGKIIDWTTGKPATYTDLAFAEPNFSRTVARTDAKGQFSFTVPRVPDVYFLHPNSPKYGKLLQTMFGQTVVIYHPGEQVRGVVVPAIPAPELSGHVYAKNEHPIAGCFVEAITRDNYQQDKLVELQVSGVRSFAYGAAKRDDPNQFIAVEWEQTDAGGAYTFNRLGADRYFVLARCPESGHHNTAPRFSYEPVAYPQANSIQGAQEILLLPGQHQTGIDLHMRWKRSYFLEGTIAFSDHSKPRLEELYSQDLQVYRSDRALGSEWIGRENCMINANRGTFRCNSLLPGTYTFYFDISGYLGPESSRRYVSQFAKISYTVQAAKKQIPFVVQLHEVPDSVTYKPPKSPTGFLNVQNPCETAYLESHAVQVLTWGKGRSIGNCYLATYFGNMLWPLPEDTYKVRAFEAAFAGRPSRLGKNSKLEAVLMASGTPVHIQVGKTSKPAIQILKATEMINMALDALSSQGK